MPDPLRALVQRQAIRLPPVLPLSSYKIPADRREWHPEGKFRPAGTISRRDQARIVVKSAPARTRNDISNRVGFAVPKKVSVCVRRKQRKEVIHALRLTGKGSRSPRRIRDWYSDIDCT